MKIKVIKVAAIDNPQATTPEWDNYKPGEYNPGVSVPLDYTITGEEMWPLTIGKQYCINRETRNGVEVPGLWQTSLVKSIEHHPECTKFTTENSIYKIYKINE